MVKRFWPYWLIRLIVLTVLIKLPFDWYSAVALAIAVDMVGGFVSSHIFRKAAEKQQSNERAQR